MFSILRVGKSVSESELVCLKGSSHHVLSSKATSNRYTPSPPPPTHGAQPAPTQLAYDERPVTDLSRPRHEQQHFQESKPAVTAAMPSVIIYASRTHSQLGQVRWP